MENYVTFNTRRKNPNKPSIRAKNMKLLTGYNSGFQPLRTDFDTIELELENTNLRKMIGLLEGKNRVLEEHCSFLKEKNLYFQTRLKDMEENEKEESKQNDDENEDEETGDSKTKSLRDRISGVLFGVALPKVGDVFAKIKEKRKEIKSLVEEHGGDERPHCPLEKVDFKQKIDALKVNLFRVAIVLGSLILISGVGYAGYKIWKTRYRNPSYLMSSDEEDSAEELFRAPGAPRSNDSIVKTNSSDSFETPGISTDFKSILDSKNSNK